MGPPDDRSGDEPTTIAQLQLDRFLDGIDPAFREAGGDATQTPEEAGNAAVVHQLFRDIGGGDYARLGEKFHDEVEFEIDGPASVPFRGVWRGREAVCEAVRRNFAMLESVDPQVVSLSTQREHVVLILTDRGRYLTTGEPYHVRCAQVFTFADGLVRRIREIVADDAPPA